MNKNNSASTDSKPAPGGKGRYSADEEQELVRFVTEQCGGSLDREQAGIIADALGRKPSSVIAKAKQLGLIYLSAKEEASLARVTRPAPRPLDKTLFRAGNALESSSDPSKSERFLASLEEQWKRLGLRRIAVIRRANLERHLKADEIAISDDLLFDATEIDERRGELMEELDATFLTQLGKGINQWRKFLRPRRLELEDLQKDYERQGRGDEFKAASDAHEAERDRLTAATVEEIFSEPEISAKRFLHLQPQRQKLFEEELIQLREHERYQRTQLKLPAHDVDELILALEGEFAFIGRNSVWFYEFEKLVAAAVEAIDTLPPTRLDTRIRQLQSEFAQQMEQKLPLYTHMEEIRQLAVDKRFPAIAQHLKFIDVALQEVTNPGDHQELSKRFADNLQKTLAQRLPKKSQASPGAIDHDARLAEWEAFKLQQLEDAADVIRRFNDLRIFVAHTPEWLGEYQLFQAAIARQRAADPARRNSNAELTEVSAFIAQLCLRIEEELALDISFAKLLQELDGASAFAEEVTAVKEQLAATIAVDPASRDAIIDIKQRFIDDITAKRE